MYLISSIWSDPHNTKSCQEVTVVDDNCLDALFLNYIVRCTMFLAPPRTPHSHYRFRNSPLTQPTSNLVRRFATTATCHKFYERFADERLNYATVILTAFVCAWFSMQPNYYVLLASAPSTISCYWVFLEDCPPNRFLIFSGSVLPICAIDDQYVWQLNLTVNYWMM